MCLEIVSPKARKMMRPEMTEDAWVICVRGAGSDAVLSRYRKELGSAITRELEDEDERHMWTVLEQFPFGQNDLMRRHIAPVRCSHLRRNSVRLCTSCRSYRTLPALGRVGLGHLLIAAPANDEQSVWSLDSLKHRLPISVQVVSNWSSLDSMPSMRAVKQALDPNNVLRGRELF